jgi:hypothetical protein
MYDPGENHGHLRKGVFQVMQLKCRKFQHLNVGRHLFLHFAFLYFDFAPIGAGPRPVRLTSMSEIHNLALRQAGELEIFERHLDGDFAS